MEQSNNDPPLATTHSPLKLCTRPDRRSAERERWHGGVKRIRIT